MPDSTKLRFFVHPLPWIIGLYFVLALIYGVVTPAWESYDEWHHFDFICFIRQNRRLPTDAEKQADPGRQLEQLPLYYGLGAMVTSWLELGDCQSPPLNWHFGKPGAGVNFVAHDPARESFPYRGAVLALHITRIFSSILGGFGVLFFYRLAKLTMPDSPRAIVLATSLAAFQPQYIFLASSVSNDIMVVVAVTNLVAVSASLIVNGLNRRGLLWWSLALGWALMSKLNAVAAIPAAGLALLFAGMGWLTHRGVSRKTIGVCLAGLCLGLMAALVLYLRVALDSAGRPELWLPSVGYFLTRFQDPASLRWDRVLPSLWHGYMTYWGSFGFGSIPLPQWVYLVIGIVCLIAVGGLPRVWQAADSLRRRVFVVFIVLIVVTVALPVGITLDRGFIYIVVGRYLLPAAGPLAILLTLGWTEAWATLMRGRLFSIHRMVVSMPAVALFVLAVTVPFGLIRPAYAQPARSPTRLDGVEPVDFRFGDSIRLIGYQLEGELRPGQLVTINLCWQVLQPMQVNYSVSVNILGPHLAPVARLDSFPGNGNYPTSIWQAGQKFCDRYRMTIPSDHTESALARLTVAIYEFDSRTQGVARYLPVFDGLDQPLEAAIFGRAKLYGNGLPTGNESCPASLDAEQHVFYFPQESILLAVKDISRQQDTIGVHLCWRADARPSQTYRVFVHLTPRGDPTQLLAQADGEPGGGDYPTDLWDKDDQISELRELPLPTTSTTDLIVEIGLYNPETGERLVVTDGSEQPLPDNAIRLSVGE